jgi:putative ATP-binding cassette transporter
MNAIVFLWKRSRFTLIGAVISSIASGTASVALVSVLQRMIGHAPAPTRSSGILFAALCLVILLSRVSSQLLLTYLAQRATARLVLQLCRQIVSTPLRKLEDIGKPRLQAALSDDVGNLINGLVTIPGVVTHATVVLLCTAYMVWLSPLMAGVVLLLLAAGAAFVQAAMRGNLRFAALAWADRDLLFAHFRSLLEGIKELKLHYGRRTAFLHDVIPAATRSYEQNSLKSTAIFSVGAGAGQIFIYVTMALAVFALPQWVGVEMRVATGFMIFLLYLMVPLEYLTYAVPIVARGNLALSQLHSLNLAPSESNERRPAVDACSWDGGYVLKLSGVTHKYFREGGDGQFNLGPIDLSIRHGELVFLIGGNGSGKTTLAKVITGLYVPDAGEVRLGNMVVTENNRSLYREQFSAVFQDFYLFDGLFGLERSEIERTAYQYLSMLQLDRHVTIVGGRFSSLNLSFGLRKRLALLVSYLENRPIYVFDEWACDQDPVFKHVFYRELLPDLNQCGKTIIVISHDDQYYDSGARFVRLENGTISEDALGLVQERLGVKGRCWHSNDGNGR